MKRAMVLATMLALGASQVSALSCMRPDAARTFNWAAQADERYAVLFGSFTAEGIAQRDIQANRFNPEPQVVTAQFSGQALGANGFANTAPFDLTVELQCAGPWCGTLPQNETAMAFVEVTDAGYVLRIDPCYSTIFAPVAVGDLDRVEACMRGEACTETPMR